MSTRSLYRVNLTGDAPVAIAATATFTSPTINLRTVDRIQAILIKQTSVSSFPDLLVGIEISADGENWTPSVNQADIISSTANTIGNKPDFADWQSVEWPLDLQPAMWIRVTFTGIGGNPADTLLEAKLLVKEQH